MTRLAPLLIVLLLPQAAAAACYVEYKAKQDSPLRLHYGIMELSGPCPDRATATNTAARRLQAGGWVLLNVMGLSQTPPNSQKRADAGAYYLRF